MKDNFFRSKIVKKNECLPTSYYFYVEGDTDQEFINNLIEKKIININHITSIVAKVDEPFTRWPDRRDNKNKKPNNKRNVIKTVLIENNEYTYGMIDKDFDNPDNPDDIKKYLDRPIAITPTALKRIFITDSHDLETFLVSKDENLLSNIFNDIVKIPEWQHKFLEDVKKSFYIAFQVGIFRKMFFDIKKGLLYKSELNQKKKNPLYYIPDSKAKEYKRFIDDFYISANELEKHREILFHFEISNKLPMVYTEFSEGLKLKISKFCKYVYDYEKKPVPPNIVAVEELLTQNECFTDGIFNKGINDIIDENGVPCNQDFWNIVNGHDLLDSLCHFNSFIRHQFNSPGKYIDSNSNRNKDFESCLVKRFNYDNFNSEKTSLYDKMHEANLC